MTPRQLTRKSLMAISASVILLPLGSTGCQPEPVGHADHSLQPPEPDPIRQPSDGEASKTTKIPMH